MREFEAQILEKLKEITAILDANGGSETLSVFISNKHGQEDVYYSFNNSYYKGGIDSKNPINCVAWVNPEGETDELQEY